MSNDLVVIKGGKDGLRVQLDEQAEWPVVLDALQAHLAQGSSFLQGAKLLLDVGVRQVSDVELDAALALLRGHGLQPDTVASLTREGRQAARAAGLAARSLARNVESAPAPGESAICLRRTVRSGQVIRHPGDVIIIGDVNAGGEVIAGGSVVIWGRVRGVVHAGAMGDSSAVICALELVPTQLRIADRIARSPEGGGQRFPEVAHIVDGHILVEAWQAFRR
jgi:septum site-determining protein MinC